MAMYDPWLQSTQTKPPPNKTTTPTLQPLRLDRAPALRGAGLFAVALGAWGLGAVTPNRQYRSVTRRPGRMRIALS